MKNLTIFTNHFYPENFRINYLAEKLSETYNVNVVSQIPNYPDGSFYPGYSYSKKRKEKIDDVEVTRLAVIPRGSKKLMLTLNYLSYLTTSFAYRIFSKKKTDHVLVYVTSPIFIAYAGLGFAKKNKCKSTLYLLDLWPGALITMLNIKNKKLIRYLEKKCTKIYKQFDEIIVSSYGFIEVLLGYGINKEKITYIPQHADEIKSEPIEIKPIKEKLKIVFTGNIGEAQGLDILVETAKLLRQDGFFDVLFTIVGDGRYKGQLINNVSNGNVNDYFEFIDRVDYSEIPAILADNHFGFVSLEDDETLSRTLPAKVQSYMAYGIPILASANNEIPLIVNRANCGVTVNAGEAKSLAKVIKEIRNYSYDRLERMSINGFNYSKKNFEKEKIVKDILNVMKEGM